MENILSKDDKLFFELLYKGVEQRDQVAQTQVRLAIQAFMRKPQREVVAKVQALRKIQAITSVSTDFAKLVSDAFNVTIAAQAFDLGWQRAFKEVPLGQNQDTWDIYDVQNGLTFHLVPEGDRIQIDGISGSKVTPHVDYYGGALGWTDRLIRYRKVAAMLDIATVFRNRFWSNKADNHYLLLAAAAATPGQTTTYQGVAADGQLRRDIATINACAFALANRCKDKGYGDTAAMELLLYHNPLDKGRILAALAATTATMQAALGRAEVVHWNVTPIATFNSNVLADHPIMILPGNKLQSAEDMPPTTFTQPKDILTLNEVQAVWSIYGAAVGDTDQAQRMNLS